MKKKIIIILLVLAALSSILFINLGIKSTAQECNDCTPIPTPPGDSDYSKINCDCENPPEGLFTFDDDSTPDTIAKNSSIQVYITGGCPPFTFSTSSLGYTFNGGVQSYETEDRSATLSSAGGSCGDNFAVVCEFTVTDNCGTVVTGTIRNTSGHWSGVLDGYTKICGGYQSDQYTGLIPPGIYKYRIWVKHTFNPDSALSCTAECVPFILTCPGFPDGGGTYFRCQGGKLLVDTVGYDRYIEAVGIGRGTWVCQ